MIVDKDGKSHRIKNEAGQAIDDKKSPEIYKWWMKKTHLRIQKAGEMEDTKTHAAVNLSSWERREMKMIQKSGKNQNAGLKQADQVLKMKKKIVKKGWQSPEQRKIATANFKKKVEMKIKSHQAPQRSKTIFMGKKRTRD